MKKVDKILEELQTKHEELFATYGNNIPTSVLSFSASYFLGVVSESRSSSFFSWELYDKTNKIVELYKDFTDPRGENEMNRFFEPFIKLT